MASARSLSSRGTIAPTADPDGIEPVQLPSPRSAQQDLALQEADVTGVSSLAAISPVKAWHRRILGRHPVPGHEVELESTVTRRGVAELLSRQTPDTTAFHDIPGPDGTPIHNVLIGPAGVFVVGILEVPNAMVLVMHDALLVSGKETDVLADLERQAEWVTEHLGLREGDMPARPVLVVSGYRALSVRQSPSAVTVVSLRGLREWLARRVEGLTDLRVAELTSLARLPRTWGLAEDWQVSGVDPAEVGRFDGLVESVRRARRTRWFLTFTTGMVTVDALLAGWMWWG